MKPNIVALAALMLIPFGTSNCHAQRFFQDYFQSSGTAYQPSDPWVKGSIYKTHTGHDGLYYNCDDQECKRNSPYIYWKNRGCKENIHTLRFVRKETRQTVGDAITRWKRGSCQSCRIDRNYPPGAGYGELKSQANATPSNTMQETAPEPINSSAPNHKAELILEEVVPVENTAPKTSSPPFKGTNEVKPKSAQPAGDVPPLKPLIDPSTGAVIPQNFIHSRQPAEQHRPTGIIGRWRPKTKSPNIQKVARKPSRASAYGVIRRSAVGSEQPANVIR